MSVFPDEICPAPRSWAEKAYPKLIHYNRLEKGGHFAAWDQPELFVSEVRTGLRSLRYVLMSHTQADATGRPRRRWYHLRPEPRRRTDFMGVNSTWWMAVVWLIVIVLIASPYPWW